MKKDGFSTVTVLILILALSITILELGQVIADTSLLQERMIKDKDKTSTFVKEINMLILQLESDPAQEEDSPFDPVWSYIKTQAGSYKIFRLEDLSSKINPAWVHPLLLERTELKTILLPDVTPLGFRDEKTALGYSLNINENFKNLVKPEALEKYCTPYSLMNVNTAYEFAMEDIYLRITGDTSEAEVFHTIIKRALREKHIITQEELSNHLGTKIHEIYPVIGTLPEMNVNYIPDWILKGILSYPFGGKKIKNADSLYEQILTYRNNHEISPDKLHSILNVNKGQDRIFCYLGTKTWFWRVTISTEQDTMEAVITCFPKENGSPGIEGKRDRFIYKLYSFKPTGSD